MSPRVRWSLLVALLGIAACRGHAPNTHALSTQPAAVVAASPLPIDPAVHVGKLANGLTYYIREHHKPEKRALLWLAVNAGSIVETDDQRGLAHFVEHMAFNGTQRFAKQAIVNYLERIGMAFGPEVNAETSFDETIYHLAIPTDEPKATNTAFEILEDWATAISFNQDDVQQEKGVLLEEWRMGRGAERRLMDKHLPVLFKGSLYAKRLPIGEPNVIKAATPAALKQFYRSWYRPNLMAVVAVGDFKANAIVEQIKKHFAGIQSRGDVPPRVIAPVPHQSGTLVSIAMDKEATGTVAQIYHKMPRRLLETEGQYRQLLVERIYHSMLNDRFEQIMDHPNAPFLGAGSTTEALARPVDAVVLAVQVKKGELKRGVEAATTEWERVRQHGFTQAELEREKARILREYEHAASERDKVESETYAQECLRHFFSNEGMPGIDAELVLVRRFLPTITLEEVAELAGRWSGADDRVVLASGPTGSSLPNAGVLLASLGAIARRPVAAYQDSVSKAPLVAHAPTAKPVRKTESIPQIGVTVWKLANGATVVVKPTTFRNDEVQFAAFGPGGHSRDTDRDFETARHAAEVVYRGGVGQWRSEDLRKRLAGKMVDVVPYIGELEQGLLGGASSRDLETLLQLVYLRFTAPHLDEQAFAAWRAEQEEAIRERARNPEHVFFDEVERMMTRGHLRRKPTTLESLSHVALARAGEIYSRHFADAGDFTFLFVGKVDLARLRPLVEQYLASLPSSVRHETWRDVGVRPPAGLKNLLVRKGAEPRSILWIAFHGTHAWSEEAEDDVSLLTEVLSIRLREEIREKMGSSYDVEVSGQLARWPKPRYVLHFASMCAPDTVDKIKQSIFREISSLQKNTADPALLEKVKALRLRTYETAMKRNEFWLSELVDHYRNQIDPREIPNYMKWVNRVTAERVQKAARDFVHLDQPVVAVLSPEAS